MKPIKEPNKKEEAENNRLNVISLRKAKKEIEKMLEGAGCSIKK